MEEETPARKAIILIRSRLCDPNFLFRSLSDSADSNFSKLKYIVSNSITEASNNSVLLLGPRGCGKNAILDLVLREVENDFPDVISVVRLNGLLHVDDACALKEIARQLCLEHKLSFSKTASFDENSLFLMAMLRECGLAHKSVIFILDEFDLFAQGKQRLLYSLLDALQSLTSQAVMIGISCRLDADQLLEKRVRSRFSHRKLMFVPPKSEEVTRLLEHILFLPTDFDFPLHFVAEFNAKLQKILNDKKFAEIIGTLSASDNTIGQLRKFLLIAVCNLNMVSGYLSLNNFEKAALCIQRQPKLENLQDASILELYLLVCMNRLEIKEQNSYNFNSVMKEYNAVHNTYQTSDCYTWSVCLRAFEHLVERELICFMDGRVHRQSIEYRPVKLLISSHELHQGLKLNKSCPAMLQKLLDREAYR